MNAQKVSNNDFPTALKELLEELNVMHMGEPNYSELSRRIARKTERRLSFGMISRLARSVDKVNKEQMELISKALNVSPKYFKEFRVAMAQEYVAQHPDFADIFADIDEREFEGLSEKEKAEKEAEIKILWWFSNDTGVSSRVITHTGTGSHKDLVAQLITS